MKVSMVLLLFETSFSHIFEGSAPNAKFGSSTSGAQTMVGLGMYGSTLLAQNGDLGTFFYLPRDFVLGTSTVQSDGSATAPGEDFFLYTSLVSTDLGCVVPMNTSFPKIHCLAKVLDQSKVASDTLHWWRDVSPIPIPSQSACDPFQVPSSSSDVQITSMCFGIATSVWKRALAITGRTIEGDRFFSTFYVQNASNLTSDSPLNVYCTFGCSSADDNLWVSSEDSFGDSIALYGDILAVGVPGAQLSSGSTVIFRAVGLPDSSIYANHRQWNLVTELTGYVSGARFGATLSLGPSLLVVASPGAAQIRGYLSIFEYARAGATSLTLTSVCNISCVAGGDFGLSLAQREAGDGWTMIVAGSPVENRVYVIWASRDRKCEAGDAFLPLYPASENRFGASVAITNTFLLMGDPGYLSRTISGLLYVAAVCPAGSIRSSRQIQCPSGNYNSPIAQCMQTVCSTCTAGTYAPEGGFGVSCSTCSTGAFSNKSGASTCLSCSVNPMNSAFVASTNGPGSSSDSCPWTCLPGFYPASSVSCSPCPSSPPQHAEYSGPGTSRGFCPWRCSAGFYGLPGNTSSTDIVAACTGCAAGKYVAVAGSTSSSSCLSCSSPPAGAMNIGLGATSANCPWACGAGSNYNTTSGRCIACPYKPDHSLWTSSASPDSNVMTSAACSWACEGGYEVDSTGLQCSQCQTNGATAPANAVWTQARTIGFFKFTESIASTAPTECV